MTLNCHHNCHETLLSLKTAWILQNEEILVWNILTIYRNIANIRFALSKLATKQEQSNV